MDSDGVAVVGDDHDGVGQRGAERAVAELLGGGEHNGLVAGGDHYGDGEQWDEHEHGDAVDHGCT